MIIGVDPDPGHRIHGRVLENLIDRLKAPCYFPICAKWLGTTKGDRKTMKPAPLQNLLKLTWVCILLATGCASAPKGLESSVGGAWSPRKIEPSTTVSKSLIAAGHDNQPTSTQESQKSWGEPTANPKTPIIATVDGQPILRDQLVDLLIHSRGVEVLETLIGLAAVKAEALRRGIMTSKQEVDRDYELALRRLHDPLSEINTGPFDRQAAQRQLDAILERRQLSQQEFKLITLRNAILRKLVASTRTFTEEEVQHEYRRQYGKRLVVRHIQRPTVADAARMRDRLLNGEDFAQLASSHSANTASASEGGLLAPFSVLNEAVPRIIRETASGLRPGEVSDVLRVGSWYHLLRLERIIPKSEVPLTSVRAEIERSLRERVDESAMQTLFDKLLRETTMTIHDRELARNYEKVRQKREAALDFP